MVTRRLLLTAAGVLATVAAVGCACLEIKGGKVTVRTNCIQTGIGAEDHTFAFVIVPNVADFTEFTEFLPENVRTLIECPPEQDELLACKPIGAGLAEDGSDTVAILCDKELRVTGPAQLDQTNQVFFLCVAPLPFGQEDIWLMGCSYVDILGNDVAGPQGGSCKAVTTMDIEMSTSDAFSL